MQVSVEAKEGLERCMTGEIPVERINEEVEKRLKKIARSAKLDGFRPGKAPLSVIRRHHDSQVRGEVFRDLLHSSYFEALSQEQLQPAGEPTIETMDKDDEEGFGYTAVFEVMPEITLNKVDDVTIKRPVAEITEEDVDEMIEKLRKQQSAWSEVERAAEDGDQVIIGFKGYMEGDLFDGGSADEVPLVLGSGHMIEGFEAGLIGVRTGETRTLELKFPEDYQADSLAGKPASFEVKVTRVSEPALPEVDEEFAKLFGISEGGVDALRKDVRTNMERELEQRVKAGLKERAMTVLLEANEFELPRALVEEEADTLKERAEAEMAQRGGQSEIQLERDLFMENARRRVALGLIIGEVVKQNEMQIDADRVRARIEQVAADYDHPDEVIKWYYSNKDQLSMVENMVLEDQVADWVMEQVKTEDEPTSFSALVEGGNQSEAAPAV